MHIVSPQSEHDWKAYYDLRWQILRAPWQQPKGSEQDEFEPNAFHVMAKTDTGDIIGVGRIHCLRANTWQIRYMAIAENYRGAGIGSKILKKLEDYAQSNGAVEITLNSRTSTLDFYLRHDYQIAGDAPTLFGEITHKNMRKILRIS